MLTEERYSRILNLLEEQGSVTVSQLVEKLEISESTIRRDLNAMDAAGLLTKVYGGAVSKDNSYSTRDEEVVSRKEHNKADKIKIAKYAASLLETGDFVYIDAGTTTELVLDYINVKGVSFVTNAISHARKLSEKGYSVILLGGEFKAITDAIVGPEAMEMLERFNFTKGFFGTNGISQSTGYSTPENKEAMVKKKAMTNCKRCFVLADITKFNQISNVTFGAYDSATVITTGKAPTAYAKAENIITI